MARQRRPVSGKVVAITGGARGIGKATAAALVRRGARVAIGDIDLALAQATADELAHDTIALELNVTDRDSFDAFLSQVEERLGPLDVIVNNAGIMPIGPFLDEDDATAERMIDINLHGVIFGSKLALARMLPRGSGHVVNIASQAGKAGLAGGATYCATKHGVVGLTESIRAEYGDRGIEASVVMPAIVNTELADGLVQTRAIKKVEPEDVAEAIVEALETGRFEVWVPRTSQYVSAVVNMLPRRGREAIGRALNAHKVLADANPAARADYEARAANSAPAEPEPEPEPDKAAKS